MSLTEQQLQGEEHNAQDAVWHVQNMVLSKKLLHQPKTFTISRKLQVI